MNLTEVPPTKKNLSPILPLFPSFPFFFLFNSILPSPSESLIQENKIAKDYWTSINFILRKWEKVFVKIYSWNGGGSARTINHLHRGIKYRIRQGGYGTIFL